MSETMRQISDAALERLLDARGNLTMYSSERVTWERARDVAMETAATHYRRREDSLAFAFREFAGECDKKAKAAAARADHWRTEADKVQREVLPWEAE